MTVIPGLVVDATLDVPVYRQIADAVVTAVGDGSLRSGDRLPPTRDLARALGINRNTVVAAYEALASDGVVSSHTGRGTFVLAPAVSSRAGSSGGAPDDGDPVAWPMPFSRAVDGPGVERLMTVYRATLLADGISFAGSYPAPELMPVEAFRRATDAVLRDRPERALAYGPTAGDPDLRETLAEVMRASGSTIAPADVLVTSGAQQGLELTFRTLLDRGDVALVEDPTYTGALSVLGSIGARVVGVPADADGLLPDAFAAALERHRPRLVYLQPTFQNPTTRETTTPRRREVVDLARRHRCAIVEDDWAGDLRFEGDGQPTLHALDGGRNVVHLSSFSKKLMPGLRIGWAVAPPEVARRIEALKQIGDCGTSPLLQCALDRFLRDGALDGHLVRVRRAYRERRDAMLASLERHLPAETTWTRPRGGLFVWVTLPDEVDGDELFVAARREGVTFSRGSLFHLDGRGRNTLRLAYAAVAPERIDEGVAILGRLVRERRAEPSRSGSGRLVETLPVL